MGMRNIVKRSLSYAVATAMVLSTVFVMPAGNGADTAKAAVKGDEASDGLSPVDKLTVSSPNGKIRVQIWESDTGEYYYSAYLNDYVVLQCSPFGLVTKGIDLTTGMNLDDSSIKVEEGLYDYDLIQGPVNHVNKEYKELDFKLTRDNSSVVMNFRVDNEGIAYRYQVDADTTTDSEEVSITSEESAFVLPDSSTLWTIGRSATYEAGEYTQRTMESVKNASSTYSTPILADTGADAGNAWVLLSEASVYNNDNPYCASVFETKSGKKDIKVKFGEDLNGEQDLSNHKKTMDRRHTWLSSVDFTGSFETPWRVAIIGEDLNAITSSTLIPDLNPPAEGDFSWVVPGTSVWSWWSTGDNIDYNSMEDYIDFCSNAGITYCLIDFGWENWADYETKVKGLVDYANDKNVGILLWYGVHKWDNAHIFDLDNIPDIEEQFAWCEEIGVKGVKVDYIESDSQFAMWNMYEIIDIAAKHHLVVNFHGVTDPNGENRTYPNLLSSEAVCGMEYFKWGNASPVETLVTLPFTRNVIGSMEYTPALFSIKRNQTNSQYSPATTGFMLSMCIEYESAVETFAQSGYVYPGYTAFPLIADVPSTWDESILLEGYPMKDVIRARRSGENWYIGAMSVKGGSYSVPLNFLDDDETYYAYIYKDTDDGENIEVETKTVTSDQYLDFDLLQYGGCAVKLSKNDPEKWTVYDDYTFYEAENADLSGNASVKNEEIYISGKAYVQGLGNGQNNSITFNIENVPEAGTYDLKVYAISANNSRLVINVNGEDVTTLTDVIGMVGNGSAVGAYRYPIDIELKEGDNTIQLYTDSGSAPKIDRIAVQKPLITDAKVTLDKTEFDYSGNKCEPAVTVTRDGKTLTKDKEYSLFYSNNKKAGTASVYVTGANGYGGQIKTDFTIKALPEPTAPAVTNPPVTSTAVPTTPGTVTAPGSTSTGDNTKAEVKKPGKAAIKSVKSPKKKQMKVVVKKVKGAEGYQISYSLNKKFKKAVNVIIKGKATSKVIKKLKSKKKYFVKARAFVTADGKKVYGAWSAVKNVKVK